MKIWKYPKSVSFKAYKLVTNKQCQRGLKMHGGTGGGMGGGSMGGPKDPWEVRYINIRKCHRVCIIVFIFI